MSSCPRVSLVLLSLSTVFVCVLSATLLAQTSPSEQVQVKPPAMRMVDPPAPDATPDDLETRGDDLHAQKLYLDALDYYRAALAKSQNKSRILNKVCRTELMMAHWRDAKKSCERSIKTNPNFADPYNNLGVALYGEAKFGPAIKEYRKAIALDDQSASFYSNLGAAYFARKDFEPALVAYQHALELDPEVFERSSRAGVQAQLPSPEDRARYDYTVAKLYAKMGLSDRALEYLRKAMEDGYKDFKNVYKDAEFAQVRKDKRFAELMASRTVPITE
jgi:tetratricopeptide (TPR) repeat protein